MIYVFKTSVLAEDDIQLLKPYLDKLPRTQWNFDLDDCDKILRVESVQEILEEVIIKILHERGFICEVLSY